MAKRKQRGEGGGWSHTVGSIFPPRPRPTSGPPNLNTSQQSFTAALHVMPYYLFFFLVKATG